MLLSKTDIGNMLTNAAFLWKNESAYLSEIDSKFGDGDHGITIGKIAALIETSVREWDDASISEFFETLGEKIMAVNGGSAGPLYGTMIGGMGAPAEGKNELDSVTIKAMLQNSLSEMRDITTAKVGDKTMMDSLIPAVEAAALAEGEPKAILKAAAEAAAGGAAESKNYISKFGRAKSYKEETIGTPDAGAISTAVFFKGLAQML